MKYSGCSAFIRSVTEAKLRGYASLSDQGFGGQASKLEFARPWSVAGWRGLSYCLQNCQIKYDFVIWGGLAKL